MSYVVGMVEELTSDFDPDEFKEMLSAYLPEAEDISAGEMQDWMQQLDQQLKAKQQNGKQINSNFF